MLGALFWLFLNPAQAQITGQVVDDVSGDPVANARVRIQTTVGDPFITAADGLFSLPDPASGAVTITAVVSYDPVNPINYITGSQWAEAGDAIEIRLTRLPTDDRIPYDPGTGIDCATCHFDQYSEWQNTSHAGAGVNTWVRDLYSGDGTPGGGNGYVFRDLHDDDNTGFCATCHTPLADAQDPGNLFFDEVTLPGGLDGVNCLACHQMADVNDDIDQLHHLGQTEYRFPDEGSTQFWVWGPLDDVSFGLMRASHQPKFSDAQFCSSCHQYNNPDTGAPGQTTYTEWLASPFSQPGPNFMRCQDCHMPAADKDGPISSLGGQPIRAAEQRRAHTFIGATPDTLPAAIDLSMQASLEAGELVVDAEVTNSGAGHAFPTGVSIRNAVLVIDVLVDGQRLQQTDGPMVPFYGSAAGSNEPDDVAGLPGRGYARVLEGRINGQGPIEFPVLFIDAESVRSDTRIGSGQSDASSYRFSLSDIPVVGNAEVRARLLYRRAWRDLAVTKNWTETPRGGPVEIEVARVEQEVDLTLARGPVMVVPLLSRWSMLVLISLLLVVAWASLCWHRPQPKSSG
ncbi:MAG: multiheme c-type cytochrome [Pseudomonadota bacterium]